MKRRIVVVLMCVFGLAVAAGWWFGRSPQWNVVLVTLDTTRADHLACYGRTSAMTPNLDRVASDGLLFERAYTVVPITLPSHATMMTGKLPPEHGLRINGISRLAESVPTLAELLRERGFRTGAFVSSLVLDQRFGLARGFESYDDRLGDGPQGPNAERSAPETVSSAIAWLNSVATEPVFCWVHLFDPHQPYEDHPAEFGDHFEGRPYDAEIAYMDQQVGRLLDELVRLGIAEKTLLIIAGDHGEGLGEHEEESHGYLAYNSTMHVPLIMRHSQFIKPGTRVADPVSLVDVFPTILDGLQMEEPMGSTGRSLLSYLQSSSVDPRPCYGETEAPLMEGGWSPLRTWTTDRWKYIQSTNPELYDLQADPGEVHNLVDHHAEATAQMRQALFDFEAGLIVNQGKNAVLSEQEQRALASLGYAEGHFVDQPDDTPRRDIKETLKYAEQVHECMHLIDRNEMEQAQLILEGVVLSLPDYSKAWGTLGVCYAKQFDYAAAEQHFQRAVELDPNQNFARIGLGRALFAQDRFEECVEQLSKAVDADPTALDAQFFLGEACRKVKRWDESESAYVAATKIAPGFLRAEIGLADLARDRGNSDEAINRYRTILQRDPFAAGAYLGLGRLLAQQNQDADAVQAFEVLLRQSPGHLDGHMELARLLIKTQNPSLHNPERSSQLAEHACQLTNRKEAEPLRLLAMVYSENQQFQKAAITAEAALEIAQKSHAGSLISEIEQELAEYYARAGHE